LSHPTASHRHPWLPDLSQLVFVLVLLKCLLDFFISFDALWHVKLGEWIWQSRSVPTSDLGLAISETPLAWSDHEWLAQIVLYWIWRVGGFLGLRLVLALIPAFIFQVAYRRLRAAGTPPLASFALIFIAAAATTHHWLARPHLLSYLCLLGSVLLWEQVMRGRRLAWVGLLVTHLLWVNLHASFLLQFAFGAVFALDALLPRRDHRPDLRTGGICLGLTGALFLVSLVNPYGLAMFSRPVTIVTEVRTLVQEWRPLGPGQLSFYPFVGYAALLAWGLWRNRRRLSLAEPLLFAGLLALAASATRHVPVLVFATLPMCLRHLPVLFPDRETPTRSGPAALTAPVDRALDRWEQRRSGGALTWTIWGLLLLASVAGTHGPLEGRVWDGVNHGRFPIEATRFLERERVEGRVFTDYGWASYLIFRLGPSCQVFIDGRAEMYGPERFREYMAILRGAPGWQDILRRHAVNVVLAPTGSRLAAGLLAEADWALVHSDAQASLFLRRSIFPDLVRRYGGTRPAPAD
jgi:hypothetical protein